MVIPAQKVPLSVKSGSPARATDVPVERVIPLQGLMATAKVKVPINPKYIFRLNKSFYNSMQNSANKFVFGQNRNFL